MTQWEFAIAMALDVALGDPHWLPHPVRAIGWMISRSERWVRRSAIPLRAAGIVLVLVSSRGIGDARLADAAMGQYLLGLLVRGATQFRCRVVASHSKLGAPATSTEPEPIWR